MTEKHPYRCPLCDGTGQMVQMIAVYRMVAAVSRGNFGWTGPTHELVQCRACGGEGVLWR